MRDYTKTFDNKEMNLKIADRGYYKIHEDPDCTVRDFEVGNSHLKVGQKHDERPGPVKHIKPEDYDGPQRSRRLEHYYKLSTKDKKKFIKEARKMSNKELDQIEKTCQAIVEHPLATNSGIIYHAGTPMKLPQVI